MGARIVVYLNKFHAKRAEYHSAVKTRFSLQTLASRARNALYKYAKSITIIYNFEIPKIWCVDNKKGSGKKGARGEGNDRGQFTLKNQMTRAKKSASI